MAYFAKLWLHTDVEGEAPLTVMYLFDTREQMDKFKEACDGVFKGTYEDCTTCDHCGAYYEGDA